MATNLFFLKKPNAWVLGGIKFPCITLSSHSKHLRPWKFWLFLPLKKTLFPTVKTLIVSCLMGSLFVSSHSKTLLFIRVAFFSLLTIRCGKSKLLTYAYYESASFFSSEVLLVSVFRIRLWELEEVINRVWKLQTVLKDLFLRLW